MEVIQPLKGYWHLLPGAVDAQHGASGAKRMSYVYTILARAVVSSIMASLQPTLNLRQQG
jgi:hypothetical protein